MKKILFAIALLSFQFSIVNSISAQEAPQQQYSVSTNRFFSNWYAQFGVQWSAFYSAAEHGNGFSHSPFKSFRSTPNISIALGKWFTPGIGLRTKLTGFWAKDVVSEESSLNNSKAFDLQEQVMLNLTNLFSGYSEKRTWEVSWFGGAGLRRNMSCNDYGFAISTGINASVKVCNRTFLYIEGGVNMAEPVGGMHLKKDNSLWNNHDNRAYLELGIKYNITRKTWQKAVDMNAVNAMHQAELDALNAQINDLKTENESLKSQITNPAAAPKEPEMPGDDVPLEEVE